MYPLFTLRYPSTIDALIPDLVLIKSIKFPIVVASVTTVEPATVPLLLKIVTVLSACDIELRIP